MLTCGIGYADLTVAGLPMHACAFRPLDTADLLFNPFRVFCSIIRMDLLEPDARKMALRLLQARQIMSDPMKELLRTSEEQGGVLESDVASCESQTEGATVNAAKYCRGDRHCWSHRCLPLAPQDHHQLRRLQLPRQIVSSPGRRLLLPRPTHQPSHPLHTQH